MNQMHGQRHRPATSSQSYPWMIGGIIVGAVSGLLSGMAEANTFTRDLLMLILWSLAGAILFSAILGGLGWLIDRARHRSRPT
jgi:hypothetical protein